jgi:hypothetical protein
MNSRCRNPNFPGYNEYGGSGIKVCDRWRNFQNFLADMGPRPPGKTLDRYPNGAGNYEPGNCRWATVDEQLVNRCNTIHLTIDGVTKPFVDWQRESGLARHVIYVRLMSGWPHKDAVFKPPRQYVKSGIYNGRIARRRAAREQICSGPN